VYICKNIFYNVSVSNLNDKSKAKSVTTFFFEIVNPETQLLIRKKFITLLFIIHYAQHRTS